MPKLFRPVQYFLKRRKKKKKKNPVGKEKKSWIGNPEHRKLHLHQQTFSTFGLIQGHVYTNCHDKIKKSKPKKHWYRSMVRVLSPKAVMIKMSTSNTPHIQYKIYMEHSSHSIQDLHGTLLTFNTRSTWNTPHIQYKIYMEHSSHSTQDLQGTLLTFNTRSTWNTPHIQHKIYREHSSHSIQDLQVTLLTFNTRSTGNTPQVQDKMPMIFIYLHTVLINASW